VKTSKRYVFKNLKENYPITSVIGLPITLTSGYSYWLTSSLLGLSLTIVGLLIMGINGGYYYIVKENKLGSFLSLYGFWFFKSPEQYNREHGYVSVMILPKSGYQLQIIANRKERYKLKKFQRFEDAWVNAFELARDLEVSIYDCSVREEQNTWVKPEEFDFYEKQLTSHRA